MGYRTLQLWDCWRNFYAEISSTKYVYTSCLWFAYLTAGVINKQLGSALPDIKQRTNVQFTEASLYILVFCVGCFIGCLMSGLIYRRIPATCYLCFACTGLSASEAVLPWCDTAVKAYIVHFFIGVCYTSILSTVVAELCALWGNKVAMPMFINSLFYGIGGIASSAITAPFLSTTMFLTTTVKTTNSTTEHTDTRSTSTEKLYIPFTVTATITIIAAFSQFILFYKSACNVICIPYLDLGMRLKKNNLPSIQRILAIVTIGASFLMAGSLNTVPYFLPYFLFRQAHISMSNSSYNLSIYAVFQVIGRFTGLLIVKKIGNFRLLVGHCIIHLSCTIGLWNCVSYNMSLSTIFTMVAGIGFGISVFDASMNSFVEETFMPVTGSLSGFMSASSIVGKVLPSAYIGYLSDTFTPLMFIYTTISEMLIFLFCFVMTYCILT